MCRCPPAATLYRMARPPRSAPLDGRVRSAPDHGRGHADVGHEAKLAGQGLEQKVDILGFELAVHRGVELRLLEVIELGISPQLDEDLLRVVEVK
eukprot:scaffold21632_cov62-Phaeocystis_antarctica.AAC.2